MLKTLNFEHLWKCVPKMYPWAPPLFRFLNTPLLTAQRKRYGYFSTWCINPVNLTMLINIVEWILGTHFSGCLHYRCRTKFDVVPTGCHETSHQPHRLHRLHRPQNISQFVWISVLWRGLAKSDAVSVCLVQVTEQWVHCVCQRSDRRCRTTG